MQTPNIPDSISFGALEELMSDAAPDKLVNENSSQQPQSFREQMERMSMEILDQSMELEDFDPMVHKVLVLRILNHFGNYFNNLAAAKECDRERMLLHQMIGRIEMAHEAVLRCPMHESDYTVYGDEDDADDD